MKIDITAELTFGFWDGWPGLAFSDICLATEMGFEGQKKRTRKKKDKDIIIN